MKNLPRQTRLPARSPLVGQIKDGDPIVLDNEERSAVEISARQLIEQAEGRRFSSEDAEALQRGTSVAALLDVASSRLERGEFGPAASTCIKALGIFGQPAHPSPWRLLAQIHIEYGDFATGEDLISTTESIADEAGLANQYQEPLQKLRDLVELKLAGLTGHEESVGLFYAAEIYAASAAPTSVTQWALTMAEDAAREEGTMAKLEQTSLIDRIREMVRESADVDEDTNNA